VLTEENTTWVKRGDRPGLRRRCKPCRLVDDHKRRPPTGEPTIIEMTRQATDYLHEDVEDLLNFGATFNEIIERGGYSTWGSMRRSLQRRGRTDLLERLKEKKVQV
jgi:hypothetical protein